MVYLPRSWYIALVDYVPIPNAPVWFSATHASRMICDVKYIETSKENHGDEVLRNRSRLTYVDKFCEASRIAILGISMLWIQRRGACVRKYEYLSWSNLRGCTCLQVINLIWPLSKNLGLNLLDFNEWVSYILFLCLCFSCFLWYSHSYLDALVDIGCGIVSFWDCFVISLHFTIPWVLIAMLDVSSMTLDLSFHYT